MDYIDEIIAYMEQNTANISIRKVDDLRKGFKISSSTFNRNFKRKTEFTPRDYLISIKIELAHEYKSTDPTLTVKEVVLKIGWDLTERQFTELFKAKYGLTFGGKSISQDDNRTSSLPDYISLREKEQLEEVLLRLVLLSGQYSIRNQGELSKTLVYELENTCFRIHNLPSAKELLFCLYLDRNSIERLIPYLVITRTDVSEHCFVPNGKDFYLNLIYQVAVNQEEQVKKYILESIMNWDDMTALKAEGELGDCLPRFYHKEVNPQINRNAGLFKYSQAAYEVIIQEFKKEYDSLLQSINIQRADLTKYIQAVREGDEYLIRSALESLCGTNTGDLSPQKLDLLLQLAECPEMEFVEFADYDFCFEQTLIAKVLQVLPREHYPHFIYNYCREYQQVTEAADEDSDIYLGNLILLDLLEEKIGSTI